MSNTKRFLALVLTVAMLLSMSTTLFSTAIYAELPEEEFEFPFEPSRDTSLASFYLLTRRTNKHLIPGDKIAWIVGNYTPEQFISFGVPDNSGFLQVVEHSDWAAWVYDKSCVYLDVLKGGKGFDACIHGTLNYDCTEYNCWRGGVQGLKGVIYDYSSKNYYSSVKVTVNENGVASDAGVSLYDGSEYFDLDYKENGVYESHTIFPGNYIICVGGKRTNQGIKVDKTSLDDGYYCDIVGGKIVPKENSFYATSFYSGYEYKAELYFYDYKVSVLHNGDLTDDYGEVSLVTPNKTYNLNKINTGLYQGTLVFPFYIKEKDASIYLGDKKTDVRFQTKLENGETYTNDNIIFSFNGYETVTIKIDNVSKPGIMVGFNNGVEQRYAETDENGVATIPTKALTPGGTDLPYKVTVYGVVDNTGENNQVSLDQKDIVLDYTTLNFVSYDADGNAHPYRTQYVRVGSKPNKVADPIVDSLSFSDWSEDPTSFQKFEFDNIISEPCTAYAFFTKPQVNIYDMYIGTNTSGAIVTDGSATAFRLPAVAISGFAPGKVIQSFNLETKNVEKVYFYNTEDITILQEDDIDPISDNGGYYTTKGKVTASFDGMVSMAEAEEYIRNKVVFVPVPDQTASVKLTVSDEIISVADNSVITQSACSETWNKLSEVSGNTLTGGNYYVDGDITKTGGLAQNGLVIKDTVYLYIPKNITLTVKGGDAGTSGETDYPGMAGIKLVGENKLFVYGEGTLIATGGKAGNGENGHDAILDNEVGSRFDTIGGRGGHGGCGAGAGIGTDGAKYEKSDDNGWTTSWMSEPSGLFGPPDAKPGKNSQIVTDRMGSLYIESPSGIKLIANGGDAGSDGSKGGKASNTMNNPDLGDALSPSGGGGAGYGGSAGAPIGLGGASGAGGGNGGNGGFKHTDGKGNVHNYLGNGGGGKGAVNGSGTQSGYGKEGGKAGEKDKIGLVKTEPKNLPGGYDGEKVYYIIFEGAETNPIPYLFKEQTITVPEYTGEVPAGSQFMGWKVKTYGKSFGTPSSDSPLTTAENKTYSPGVEITIQGSTYGDITLVPVIAPLPGNFAIDTISVAAIENNSLCTYTLNVTKNGTSADLGTLVFKGSNGESYNVNSAAASAGTYTLRLTDGITINAITFNGTVIKNDSSEDVSISKNDSASADFKSMEVAVIGKDVGTVAASGAAFDLVYNGNLSTTDTAVFAVLTQSADPGDTLYTILVDGEEIPADIAQAKFGTRAVVNYSTVNVDVTTNVTEPLTVLLKTEGKDDILLLENGEQYSVTLLSDGSTYKLFVNDINTGKTVTLNRTTINEAVEYYKIVIVSRVDGVLKKLNQTIKVNNEVPFTLNNITFTAIALSGNECTITSNGTKAAIVTPSATLETTYIDYYTVTYTPGAFCTGTALVDRTLYLKDQEVVLKDFDGLSPSTEEYYISAWNDGSKNYSSGSAVKVTGTTTFTSIATKDNLIVHYVDHFGEVGTVSRLPIAQKIVAGKVNGDAPSFTDGILNYRFKGWEFSEDNPKKVYSIYEETNYTPEKLLKKPDETKHVTFSAIYDIEYARNIVIEPSLHEEENKTIQFLQEKNQAFTIDYTITTNGGINRLILIPEYDSRVFEIENITSNAITSLGAATVDENNTITFRNAVEYSETGAAIVSITYKVKTLSPGTYPFGFKLNCAEDTLNDITFNNRSYAYLNSPGAIDDNVDTAWEVKLYTDNSKIKGVIVGDATITIPEKQSVVYSGNQVSAGHDYLLATEFALGTDYYVYDESSGKYTTETGVTESNFSSKELYEKNTINNIFFRYSGFEKQNDCTEADQTKFTINWYDKDGNLLSEAPVNASTYAIGVSASACLYYREAAEVKQKFTIEKAKVPIPKLSDCCDIDYNSKKITVKEGYEISTSISGPFSTESLENMNPSLKYYLRKAEDENHFASDPVSSTPIFTVSIAAISGEAFYCTQKFGFKIERPSPDPTNEGYKFGGWYSDEDLTQAWNFGADTIRDDMILYPKWIKNEAASSIVVGVVDQNGVRVSGASVELRLGVKKVAASVTGANGYYRFDNVEAGTYDVVAFQDGKVKTAMIKVTEVAEYEADIELPNGEVNSRVEFDGDEITGSKSEINSTVVGGLDDIASSYIDEANADNRITIKLMVEPKEDIDSETQAAIKAEAGSGTKVEFLDLSLFKIINDGVPSNIGSDNRQLLTIVIPFDFTGVDVNSVSILRCHDSAEKLTKNPAPGDEGFVVNANEGTITVYAYKFSEYALGYKIASSGSGAGSSGPYIVTVNTTKNGSAVADKEKASAGTTVKVKLTTNVFFTAAGIVVSDEKGNKVEVKDLGGGEYSFKMPKSNVTVNAFFSFISSVHDCPRDITCPIDPFTDTLNDYWWHDGIHYCVENKLMVGMGDKLFVPDGDTSRAMVVTILWRLSGSQRSKARMTFTDVPRNVWYTEAVKWGQENGVVKGYSDEEFAPDKAISREEMMTIFCRYFKFRGGQVNANYELSAFKDAEIVSTWAEESVKWSVNNSVILGDGDLLNPSATCTRAQAAAIVQRFCEMFGLLEK